MPKVIPVPDALSKPFWEWHGGQIEMTSDARDDRLLGHGANEPQRATSAQGTCGQPPSVLRWGFSRCYEIISPKDAEKILIAGVRPLAGREHEERCVGILTVVGLFIFNTYGFYRLIV